MTKSHRARPSNRGEKAKREGEERRGYTVSQYLNLIRAADQEGNWPADPDELVGPSARILRPGEKAFEDIIWEQMTIDEERVYGGEIR